MKSQSKIKENLKQVLFYNTIGIVIFSICFVFMGQTESDFFKDHLDLRYFGVIFLCSMMGYTVPKILEMQRMANKSDQE